MRRAESCNLVASMFLLLSSSLGGRCPHGLHFQLDVDAVADQHTARLERLVPFQTEVFTIERAGRDEPDALVAPGIGGAAAVLDLERDRPRHVPDGEITGHAVAGVLELLDP